MTLLLWRAKERVRGALIADYELTSKTIPMKKIQILFAIGLLGASFALTGCNTSRGFGEDVEELGEEVQEAAD